MKLLRTLDVARFVSDGYLRLGAIVPPDINAAALKQIKQLADKDDPSITSPESGTPFKETFTDGGGIRQMLEVPEVAGAIQSLVGSDSVFDHLAVHHNPAGSKRWQHLHADTVIDSGDPTFDIQVLYIPHDVAPDTGGTRFVPGTHIRRVHETSVARYQHIAGEQCFTGEAGTVMIWHHGIWHAGQTNPSGTDRWMFKIRLNPTQPQVRLWDDSDYDEVTPPSTDHIFATTAEGSNVSAELRRRLPWSFGGDHLLDLMEKVRLWRYLSGDSRFDIDWYHTRIENRAELLRELEEQAS